MAILFIDGAEHRSTAVSNGMWDPVGGDTSTRGTIDTGTSHTGAASWRFNATPAVTLVNRKQLGGASVTVVHCYLRIATVPSTDANVIRIRNAADTQWASLKYVSGSGLVVDAYNGVSNPESSAWGVSLNTWYRLEILVDTSTNPWQVKGRVDGVEKTLSPAFASITHDVADVGLFGSPTADIYIDDVVMFTGAAGDYPTGALQVERVLPGSSGTHNLDASPSSFFGQHDGATGTALTNGETAAWQRVDDVPIGATSDYLYVTGTPGGTQYAELQFADIATVPTSVKVVESVRQATAGGSTYGSKVTDDAGASTSAIQTALDPNTATEVPRAVLLTTKPSGGAWSTSAFNSLRYRFGYTTDASPEVRMYAVMAEVSSAVTSGQTLLPDADVTTTGWTTAPLFSKLNDGSDATIITATAS